MSTYKTLLDMSGTEYLGGFFLLLLKDLTRWRDILGGKNMKELKSKSVRIANEFIGEFNIPKRWKIFTTEREKNIGEYKMSNVLDQRIIYKYYCKLHEDQKCGCQPCDGELGCPYECLAFDEEARKKIKSKKTTSEYNDFITKCYEYVGETEPVNCYFLTISPAWDDNKDPTEILKRAKYIKKFIQRFKLHRSMNGESSAKWFRRCECVVELGKNGTHPHAHVVLIPYSRDSTRVKTYINKGNFHKRLRALWKDMNNYKGVLDHKVALKTTYFIPEYLKDKLDYLDESTKPEDHQNNPSSSTLLEGWEYRWRQ